MCIALRWSMNSPLRCMFGEMRCRERTLAPWKDAVYYCVVECVCLCCVEVPRVLPDESHRLWPSVATPLLSWRPSVSNGGGKVAGQRVVGRTGTRPTVESVRGRTRNTPSKCAQHADVHQGARTDWQRAYATTHSCSDILLCISHSPHTCTPLFSVPGNAPLHQSWPSFAHCNSSHSNLFRR